MKCTLICTNNDADAITEIVCSTFNGYVINAITDTVLLNERYDWDIPHGRGKKANHAIKYKLPVCHPVRIKHWKLGRLEMSGAPDRIYILRKPELIANP